MTSMKQRDEDEKAGSILLETPVVPVSCQLSAVLKAINLPHGKIEKPKSVTSATCFDRSSLRADEWFYLSGDHLPLSALQPFLPLRTNHLYSRLILARKKVFIHLGWIPISLTTFYIWFASRLFFCQFHFLSCLSFPFSLLYFFPTS